MSQFIVVAAAILYGALILGADLLLDTGDVIAIAYLGMAFPCLWLAWAPGPIICAILGALFVVIGGAAGMSHNTDLALMLAARGGAVVALLGAGLLSASRIRADAALHLGVHRRLQVPQRLRHRGEQRLGLITRGDDRSRELVDDRGGEAQHGVGRGREVERSREPVPELRRRLQARLERIEPDGRAHTTNSTPSTSEMVRWASSCSGASRWAATLRYRVIARRSSIPSNWGRK